MHIIHWFRRDLRLSDNTALNAAIEASAGHVVPVFVLDEAVLKGRDIAPARVHFMLSSLAELDGHLRSRGSRLIVRKGNPQVELLAIAREVGAEAVYYNRDYTPLARRRDAAVNQALVEAGLQVQSFKDLVIHEEDELLTGSKKPYAVFSPYKKNWLLQPKVTPVDHPLLTGKKLSAPPEIATVPVPNAKDLGFVVTQKVPTAGAAEAQRLLRAFVDGNGLNQYDKQRDDLGLDATSRLSPHLHIGTLSPRACYQTALHNANYVVPSRESRNAQTPVAKAGADNWISELIWREFYMQLLYHFPHADQNNFNKAWDGVRFGSGDDPLDQARFAAWCAGKTGYPIVDAAVRQMNETAWMHNRARMIAACFLTRDLLLDWRWGESYFMQKLCDGDAAANNGNWQWAASVGADAQPYFRVFNPLLQSQRFDPKGSYIRRWVPELARVPDEFIHEPWLMPPQQQLKTNCVIGQTYPRRIVDHAVQKDKAIAMFKDAKPSAK